MSDFIEAIQAAILALRAEYNKLSTQSAIGSELYTAERKLKLLRLISTLRGLLEPADDED